MGACNDYIKSLSKDPSLDSRRSRYFETSRSLADAEGAEQPGQERGEVGAASPHKEGRGEERVVEEVGGGEPSPPTEGKGGELAEATGRKSYRVTFQLATERVGTVAEDSWDKGSTEEEEEGDDNREQKSE